jgi:hypothetical protein
LVHDFVIRQHHSQSNWVRSLYHGTRKLHRSILSTQILQSLANVQAGLFVSEVRRNRSATFHWRLS